MPDMNGIETVRRIRCVIHEDVPIIVLTKPVQAEEPDTEKLQNLYDYSGKRVLLVEDNALNRELSKAAIFSMSGY